MNFKQKLQHKQQIINNRLMELIKINNVPETLMNSMKYSLEAGGKRIRPILTLTIAEALGGNTDDAMDFGCAIELIHTYSLIHDDLPAMDNDDYRRGKLTNHKVFGEAIAILAGDALLNFAFEFLLEKASNNLKEPYIKALSIISKASGSTGMIGGQVIDIESGNKKINLDELYNMHRLKTGAMIEASCIVGCVLAERYDKINIVKEYSQNIGIAFQIVDDILDCIGDKEKLGKSIGKDEKDNKSTFVTLLGLERAKELAKEHTEKAISLAEEIDSTGFLTDLTNYLLNREN
ncbi:MAG: polyprenyl synthetase family protein [Clostridiales bacterium]|nr:polyprenyl synthetase family protein [Clostridiales bacterium]